MHRIPINLRYLFLVKLKIERYSMRLFKRYIQCKYTKFIKKKKKIYIKETRARNNYERGCRKAIGP